MGRQERPLDPGAGPLPAFAFDLRELRRAAGNPGYRTLAQRAGYSPSALAAAANGRQFPSLSVTLAYVGACGGDPQDWQRRWEELAVLIGPPSPLVPVPRQLPPDVFGFTGRRGELAELDRLLDAGDGQPVVISAVSGTGGVGKTALAVHWAHRVADRFTDGQLYVDLRGYDPDQPLDPAEVLAAFLRALGVPGDQVPYDVTERASRYRAVLAGRHLLVLLDNARSAEQVRLLLPDIGSCFVLVTSRDSLADLATRHFDLDRLPLREAVGLLRTLVGARIDARPAAAEELAGRCARLPLALRLAAEIALARPLSTVDDLVAELADERRRLDLLDAGADERTAVRAVFSWSYQRLPEPAATLFRLLGLAPGQDIDNYALAALAGVDLDTADELADILVRAHLVERTGTGRLRLHDLLRAYAAELAGREPDAPRRDALTRLLRYYLATTADAVDTLFPAELHRRPRVERPDSPIPPVGEPEQARAWLAAERANLLVSAGFAAQHGWPAHVDQLVQTISYHLETGGHYLDALVAYQHALTSARETGDRRAQGAAWMRMGTAFCLLGRQPEAVEHFHRAVAIRRELNDLGALGRTLCNLSSAYERMGRFTEAAEHLRESLDIMRQVGDRQAEAIVLSCLAHHYVAAGSRYQEALECGEQAARLSRELGDRSGEGTTLGCVAYLLVRFGRHADAAERATRALALLREAGDRYAETQALDALALARFGLGYHDEALAHVARSVSLAEETGDQHGGCGALDSLALVYQRTERYSEALAQWRRELALARKIGYRRRELSALNGIGEALRAIGEPDQARAYHLEALHLAGELDNPDQRARACVGLGYLAREPRDRWRQALALYTELGLPEADEVRTMLTALDAVLL